MGNLESRFFRVCGSALKRKKKNNVIELKEEEESNFIEENDDGYFQKDDFAKITAKYPKYNQWMANSMANSMKEKPKQKRIKWKPGEVIGTGSFGRVMMGFDVENGCMMAVKQVQMGAVNTASQQERVQSLEIEIEILSQFSHNNIVRYYGSERTKDTFNIFLEYISGGTIASLLDKYGPFNENIIRVYTRQILQGLEYLHVRNTIHRDIKGANVLVDNSGICKLTDFGTAKRISSLVEAESKYLPSIRGTVNWMAPEVIRQTTLSRFCDIWSVGCTVIEMATGKPPWSQLLNSNANSVSILYQIAQAKSPPPIPPGLSNEAVDFLNQCFKINPQERTNVVRLLQHSFISGVSGLYRQLDDSTSQEHKLSNSPLTPNKSVSLKKKSKLNQLTSKSKATSSTDRMINEIPFNNGPLTLPQLSINSIADKENQLSRAAIGKNSASNIITTTSPISTPQSNIFTMNAIKEEDYSPHTSIMNVQRLGQNDLDTLSSNRNNLEFDKLFGSVTDSQPSSRPLESPSSQAPLKIPTAEFKTNNRPSREHKLSIEVDTTTRYDPRKNLETRSRPLGQNKRIRSRKNGYSNLSADESIVGNSYMNVGSPLIVNETSDDKWNITSRTNTNSVVATPNGGGTFPWPEVVQNGDLQEVAQKLSTAKPVKIEEEEKEEESLREPVALDLYGHDHDDQSKTIHIFRENLDEIGNYHNGRKADGLQEQEDSIHNIPDFIEDDNPATYTINVIPDKDHNPSANHLEPEFDLNNRQSVITFGVRSSLSNNNDDFGSSRKINVPSSPSQELRISPEKFSSIQGNDLIKSAEFGTLPRTVAYNNNSNNHNTYSEVTQKIDELMKYDAENTQAMNYLKMNRPQIREKGQRMHRLSGSFSNNRLDISS